MTSPHHSPDRRRYDPPVRRPTSAPPPDVVVDVDQYLLASLTAHAADYSVEWQVPRPG